MKKETTHQEDITHINVYALNPGAPKYIKQILTDLKKETHKNTTIVETLNTPLTEINRSSEQKVNKEISALKNTLDQMDIIDIYTTFHPKTTEYTFFTCAHEIF